MKKLLSLLLVLALLLGTAPALGEADPVPETGEAGIPAVGDVVEGFEVMETREFSLIGAQMVLFEHQKTGAKLLYIANGDTNRAFQLSFPTRMTNEKGLPHVFEHGTLSGSKKYPSASLWNNASMQTYNTYMNAYTTDAVTSYPLASLSEEQLLKLADMYTDMCLNPCIMEDESIYRTEAWRYEMANADAELTYNGTVYSEMKGAWTLDHAGLMAANKATFPGASVSYDYGGNPDYIPEMTWEELKEYHNKYYHPSNCLALLYGSFEDYTAFLKLLDEAFAPFEKAEISLEEADYVRIAEPVVTSFDYPVAEGPNTENQSVIFYYILCPGMKGDVEQETLIDHACDLLNDSGSSLKQTLQEIFPSGAFSVGREVAAPDDAIIFTAKNLNAGDAELFKQTVDAALAEAAQEGFKPELVDNIATTLKFNAKLASEQSDPVEGVIYNLSYNYAVTGDIFNYVDAYEALDNVEEENNDGLLAGAVARWLVNPELYTLTTASPAAGQKEVHDAELAAKLAEIKAGMTEEEIQAVVDATNAVPEPDDTTALLAELTAVTVSSLPEEVKTYELRDETGEDGVRRIEAVTAADGISYIMLNLDAAALPQEDIHYMRLFTRLLCNMDTENHSWKELNPLISRYLYGSTFGVFVSGWKEAYHPYLVAEWYALDEDLEAGYQLAEEILYHTRFTDVQRLQDRVASQKEYVRSMINNSPLSVLLDRQLGISGNRERYYNYLNFVEYYDFLVELEQKIQENPEEVIARLEKVQQFFANRSGAVCAIAACDASLELNRPLADAFFAKLDDTAREPAVYDLPAAAAREGLIADTNIQFNIVSVPWTAIDPEADGAAYSALGQLISDMLLWPDLRDQAGAYGAYCVSSGDEIYIYTYRDPNVAETFTYFDELPDKVAALTVDQDKVDNYIISTYSELAKPAGDFTGAIAALNNRISGKPDDLTLQTMHALKTATPESLKTFAAYIADMMNTGIRGTAGGAAAVNANADLYEAVLNPFNMEAVDLSGGFEDVPEDHEYHQVVMNAVTEGIMAPLSETAFGVDEESTVGDYLGSLYVVLGGGSIDAQACLDWLAANGLADASTDLSTPLTEGYACDLITMLGGEAASDDPGHVMTRGELANFLMGE